MEETKKPPHLLLVFIIFMLAVGLYVLRPENNIKEEGARKEPAAISRTEEKPPETPIEYLAWLEKKASSGDSNAMFRMGNNYRYGYNGLEPDSVKAIKWYKKAARHGDGDAMNTLASMYGEGEGVPLDHEKAFDLYMKALENGSKEAPYNLSRAYYKGLGVNVDYLMSGKYLAMSAKSGKEGVQEVIDKYSRKCHETRVGEKIYYDMKSCYMAAYSEDALAAHAVAISFYEGRFGQEVDHKKAFEWFQKAAKGGFSGAQYYLAMLYDKGLGVDPDKVESYAWIGAGIEQKDFSVRMLRKAKQAKDVLYSQLSEEQRLEAEEKLKEYIDNYSAQKDL